MWRTLLEDVEGILGKISRTILGKMSRTIGRCGGHSWEMLKAFLFLRFKSKMGM
jgi:hypothetical protein